MKSFLLMVLSIGVMIAACLSYFVAEHYAVTDHAFAVFVLVCAYGLMLDALAMFGLALFVEV